MKGYFKFKGSFKGCCLAKFRGSGFRGLGVKVWGLGLLELRGCRKLHVNERLILAGSSLLAALSRLEKQKGLGLFEGLL